MQIEWKPSPAQPGVERTAWRVPPRDRAGGWTYVVRSTVDDIALSIDVGSRDGKMVGNDLSLHLPFPASLEDVITRETSSRACKLLKAGHCWCSGYTTSLGADEMFAKFGVQAFEQPESFWLELERRLLKKLSSVLPWRTALKCTHCNGTGVTGAPETE